MIQIFAKLPPDTDLLAVTKIEEVNWLLHMRAIGLHEFEHLFNGTLLASRDGKLDLFIQDSLQQFFKCPQKAMLTKSNCTLRLASEFNSYVKSQNA